MYLMQYANEILFENEKQTKFFEMFLEKYPYLNLNLKDEEIMSKCTSNVNENTKKIIKHIQHDFKYERQNYVLNYDQLNVLNKILTRLHVLEGTLGSRKTFFIKYFTHYLQMQGKNVLLTSITKANAL
jgi:hypothetical protein